MQYAVSLLALAASAFASPAPQGVTSAVAPSGSAPPGCSPDYSGNFEITVVKPSGMAKRDLAALEKRAACGGDGTLVISLAGGKLTDAKQRTGYIASNYQFQFDAPPQAGALVTSGFSVCGNQSLALGPTTVFYECLSGGFYNLYNTNWAPQCMPVAINAVSCGGSGGGASASAAPDGQPQASSAVTQKTDGQPQATSAGAVASQKTDGQPNASSATAIPVAQLTDGQPNMPTALVSQIRDGQPQATAASGTTSVAAQITDGQPQVGNATVAATPTTSAAAIQTAAAAALPTLVAEFAAVVAGAAAVILL